VNQIAGKARQQGIRLLVGEYLPTAKNKMVQDLYDQMGFAPQGGKWELDMRQFKELKTFIKLK
jgi:predicted enzyme involved in methoxymalonyl-ACP biosynthesis